MNGSANGSAAPAASDRGGSSQDCYRNCDIVMKGGITSGIVYPPAILELAKTFCFRNIGGTSAGAIAASATAAAEYRRITGGGLAGFERFARVPTELGKEHALLRLFTPVPAAKPIFDAVTAVLTAKSRRERAAVATRLMRGPLRRGALAGAVGGFALAAVALDSKPRWRAATGVFSSIALSAVGACAGAAYQGVRYTLATLQDNFYGMCVGLSAPGAANDPTIGAWLSALLDEIAGLSDEPLTFGHLWYGPSRRPAGSGSAPGTKIARPEEPEINLEMVTTCLSHGRPYTFPIDANVLFFDPNEMRRYFPDYVVRWMETHARTPSNPATPHKYDDYKPLLGLPTAADLPVVVAARMSLAFPLLLSAVKLYAFDYNPPKDRRTKLPEPCWFTDGGLSSNFPIALFDSPLPRWPTFAINLGAFSKEQRYDAADESKNVWMPDRNDVGLAERWTRFTSLSGFFGAMLGAIKDWNDNVQSTLPGFRDRIVTVLLQESEGGLNLDMDPATIERLVKRGAAAGKRLVEHFNQPSVGNLTEAMDWENHRWVRYRSALASMERYLSIFSKAYCSPQPGDLEYPKFIAAVIACGARAYRLSDPISSLEPAITGAIVDLAENWQRTGVHYDDGAPRPHPELVHRARQ